MDVHCTTCREPWDVYHLWHEAIFDTDLSAEEAESWSTLPSREKLSPLYRAKFQAAGWEFGQSVVNVLRCPCCPEGSTPDPERLQIKAAIEELLGDDQDGIAASFEDHKL